MVQLSTSGRTVKPSLLQKIFAKNWPMKAYFFVAASLGVCVAVVACQPSAAMFHDWGYLLLFIISVVLAPVLFIFLSMPCSFIVRHPLFLLSAKLNGAPFHIGDRVCILVGPHLGRVVQIYEIWSERGQVRVELNEQTREEVKDVFSYNEVCRESHPPSIPTSLSPSP